MSLCGNSCSAVGFFVFGHICAPARPAALPFLFGVAAEGVSVETEGFCPAGRAFFLSLNKKKQKINTGAAPLWTRF